MNGEISLTQSRNGVPIRLTEERWRHIVIRHSDISEYRAEILQTVADPDSIQEGDEEALLAVRSYPGLGIGDKVIVAVYRETGPTDGFIITAYLTNETSTWRRTLWSR